MKHVQGLQPCQKQLVLLQAVQHLRFTGKTMIFNFVYFSIQDILAAYYIAHLSPEDKLDVLNKHF